MQSHYDIDYRIRTKAVMDSLEEPVVVRVNEFHAEPLKLFTESMGKAHRSPQPVIPVVIDSFGGEVYSLLAMVDLIINSNKPVATIVEGKAMSCGVILAAFGTNGYRFASENSTFLIHEVSTFTGGKVEEVKVSAKEAERLNKKIFTMLAKKCGQPKDYFFKMIHDKKHADWYIGPKEAKGHNLIDHIGMPEMTLKVSVDYQFGLNTGRSV